MKKNKALYIEDAAKAAGVYDQLIRIVGDQPEWIGPAPDISAFLVDAQKKSLVSETKAEANRRILAILPEWKQRNYTARAVEKLAAGEVGDDEWNAMNAAWTAIKAIRVASDAIEAEIAALTDEQAGQYDVAASNLWP